jgi:RNA polymerase sigma factor (sigma-70 family)
MASPVTDSVSRALEALLERFAAMVRAVGRRHGLTEADVDEAIQEVRIRLWRARPDGASLASLPTSYVYQAARSAVLDLVRARRSRDARSISLDDATEASLLSGDQTDHAARRNDVADHIVRAVAELPEARRVAVRLYLGGYEREEIARMLGWSEAKTRNLLYRGLADVKARLAREGIAPEART